MAFTVQADTGLTAGANAYITVAEFKAYHDDRGNSYSTSDPLIQKGIVKATDHLDHRWLYKGQQLEDVQTTEWPRENVWDRAGNEVEGIPAFIKKACAEYALRATTQDLEPDLDQPTAAGGIKRTRDKVDVIETEVEYQDGGGLGTQLAAWPAADRIVASSGQVVSASGGGRLFR